MEHNRNIVITAVSSDLGAEFLSFLGTLSRESINIIATSFRSPPPLITSPPHTIKILENIDLTNEKDLITLQNEVQKKFHGPFDVIHFSGDFWEHKPLIKTDLNEIKSLINSHYISLLGVARYLTPLMIERKGGRIVAFSCNSVIYNYPDLSPFTNAKAAVESFIKCYANEHLRHGIAATAVALPTMLSNKVTLKKDIKDRSAYITPNELASIIYNQILKQEQYATGNIVKLTKYNPNFYHSSYYDRNPSVE